MSLSIRPLAPSFAAELRGVDLRQRPDTALMAEIYDAFLEHAVLVLPGQALDIDQQVAFAQGFGELWLLPPRKDDARIANRAIDDVSNVGKDGSLVGAASEKVMFQLGNRLWHSDLSFRPIPAQASMLHALEICEEGGETEFADLRAAYDALPEARQTALEGLIAEHSLAHSRIKGGYGGLDAEALRKSIPPSPQPVVRVHPETGRKNLFIGAHAARILGMKETGGAALIEELIAFSTQPRFVYSHRWAVHDLVIWDNRRTLHRGRPFDADGVRRVMHRATVQGEGQLVIDGEIAPVTPRRIGPAASAAA